MDRIRSNPGLPMPALRDAAREEFTLGIRKTQAYKAKRKALDQINGSHREQYKRIWEYCALHDVLPDVEHMFCNLHIYKNFKKLFKGEKMKEFMQNASKVSCVKYFARIMEQIKEADPKAHEWLMNVHPRHWSRSHFSTFPKCDKLLNNYWQGKAPEVEANVLLEAVEERPKLPVRIIDSAKAQLSRKTMIVEKIAKSKAAKQVSIVGAVDDTVGRFRGTDTVCAMRTILAQKRESLKRGCTNEDAMDEATTTEFTPTGTEPPIEAASPAEDAPPSEVEPADAAPPDAALPEDVFREISSTRNPATPRKTARTRKAATPMKSADTSKTQEKPATPRNTVTTRKAMAARKPVETTPSQEKPVTLRKAVVAKKPTTRKGTNTSKTEMLSARTRRAQERPATTKKAQERPANPANTRKAQEKPTTPANKRKAQEKSAVSTSKYQIQPASTSKSQGKPASKYQGAITKKPVKSMQEELLQLKKEVDNTKDLLMLELKRIQDLRKRGAAWGRSPGQKMFLFNRIWLLPRSLMLLCIFCVVDFSAGLDRISLGQSLNASQTIISGGGKFELGFFTRNSVQFYMGIWYKNIPGQTIVWVANRDMPIPVGSYSLSQLVLSADGNLTLFDGFKRTIWSTNSTFRFLNATEGAVVLLDTGNLVLSNEFNVVWQSFDYPTDTFLPGGKLGLDKTTNRSQVLTSWRSSDDPSSGTFSFGIDPSGSAEFFTWRNRSERYWKSGAWVF
ncbi:hypothetical protein RJ640_017592 [Escallonia rubra]|uniref:Bulb-type lectin domain-containing protein n=1 Tax=Escallonia rubra TaxID=112253 RepID=A0AA88UBJ2_9ASTE|nr:hypothetical protein RJ640_017592 [Escallonia rubra]